MVKHPESGALLTANEECGGFRRRLCSAHQR